MSSDPCPDRAAVARSPREALVKRPVKRVMSAPVHVLNKHAIMYRLYLYWQTRRPDLHMPPGPSSRCCKRRGWRPAALDHEVVDLWLSGVSVMRATCKRSAQTRGNLHARAVVHRSQIEQLRAALRSLLAALPRLWPLRWSASTSARTRRIVAITDESFGFRISSANSRPVIRPS